jgi:TolA-binding protein
VTDPAQRPIAPMPSPRALACNPIGTVLHVASELIECGRARFQRGDLDEARSAFEKATKETNDRRLLAEARYWLGETLLRLGRTADVERIFLLVSQDDPRSEFGLYAADDLGWVALEQGSPMRALAYFEGALKANPPAALLAHLHHGRAMALYGLKRYPEARDEWARLLGVGGTARPNAPASVVSEANFWLGDTQGRLGDYKAAVPRLQAFVNSRPRILIANGYLSLGWWSRAAGQPAEAVKTYRALLSAYPNAPEAIWARAGLAQALLDQDDYAGAREEARQVETLDRTGTLSLPTWLIVRRWLADKSRADDGRALDEQLLARTLEPATRAWVLLVSAEQSRQAGQLDEARTRFDLVRQNPVVPAFGLYASLRLAQSDFDLREFAQAETGVTGLVGENLPPDLRAAALVLGGESAYWARHYDQAASFYGRFLTDLPGQPVAPKVVLALGWAEFRRGRDDAARQRWASFAQQAPSDPRAADALLLAAELAAKAGDVQTARAQLSEVALRFANTESAQVAMLNRAILSINATGRFSNVGRPEEVLGDLSALAQRAPQSPYVGRARLAHGVVLLSVGRFAQAQPDFQAALAQGEDVLAHLGLGVVAFARAEWDGAGREFSAAREGASGSAAATAQYGLAAVAFNSGKPDDFKRLAAPLLAHPEDPRIAPVLLGMESVAAQQKKWTEAREVTVQLASRFPQDAASAAALADLGTAAAADQQWPLSREMFETLARRYPNHPVDPAGHLAYGETLLRTNSPAEARREIETFMKAAPRDPRMPEAMVLLAQAREAGGDRAGALDLYARVEREYPNNKGGPAVLLGGARLYQADGKWNEARGMLKLAIDQGDPVVVTEAAYRLGEGLRAAGQNEDAVEAYMTAAYVAPDSVWARRGLLGAGQSFSALKQPESAAIVYKKLLAASGVEPELAAEAKKNLMALGVN